MPIADAAPRLAAGDAARFLTDVARGNQGQTRRCRAPHPGASIVRETVALQHRRAAIPAGERQAKRVSALAENLKRWLKGRSEKS